MRSRWVPALGLLLCFVLSGVVAASAAPPTTGSGGEEVFVGGAGTAGLSEAELFDIGVVAESKGISMEQAIAELAGQNEFATLATELSEEFPDEFAYAKWDKGQGEVGMKGELPARAAEAASQLPGRVKVVQGVGWAERDVKAAGEALHYAVRDAAGGAEVQTDIDTESGRVSVTVDAAPGASAARSAQALATAEGVAKARSRVPAGVTVAITTGALEGGADTVYGGGHLGSCTAGFSVKKVGYSHGLLTAEHCPNSQTYAGREILFYRGALAKSWGDAQWHSSSEAASASFYYASGSRRTITATVNAVNGQTLCKYGKTTKNTCDDVYRIAQCRGDYCNLIMMKSRKADGGDSGGPVFWGHHGYGIHSGYKKYLLKNRDMYTPIRSTATQLGLTVKLSSS